MGNHGGVVDVLDSDWGDFRRRRAVDISSCLIGPWEIRPEFRIRNYNQIMMLISYIIVSPYWLMRSSEWCKDGRLKFINLTKSPGTPSSNIV